MAHGNHYLIFEWNPPKRFRDIERGMEILISISCWHSQSELKIRKNTKYNFFKLATRKDERIARKRLENQLNQCRYKCDSYN